MGSVQLIAVMSDIYRISFTVSENSDNEEIVDQGFVEDKEGAQYFAQISAMSGSYLFLDARNDTMSIFSLRTAINIWSTTKR